MGFEPQKLYIGVIDFFAILLPGALLSFLLLDEVTPRLGDRVADLDGAEASLAFLFASYLLGHFIFLVASVVLDELFYDRVRRATPVGQVRHLANGGKPASRLARAIASVTSAHTADAPSRHAELLRDSHLGRIGAERTINAFQWSKARLSLQHPEAAVTVQRFEADSKFFRSLVVVLVIVAGWGVGTGRVPLAIACVVLAGAAFVRYVDQRVKATRQAYWYVITIEALDPSSTEPATLTPGSAGLSHAGGVVYRWARGASKDEADSREYLLVHETHDTEKFVLPKGHIKRAERVAETAVREVLEEAGVWARVVAPLGEVTFSRPAGEIPIPFFLMEAVRKDTSSEATRRNPSWLALGAALEKAAYPETQELLARADAMLRDQPSG